MPRLGRKSSDSPTNKRHSGAWRRWLRAIRHPLTCSTQSEAVAKLLDTDITVLGRYDDDGAATAIGSWSASPVGVPAGLLVHRRQQRLDARRRDGQAARVEGTTTLPGRRWTSRAASAGVRRSPPPSSSRVGPWGCHARRDAEAGAVPRRRGESLAAFTDLGPTAVANAQSHDQVRRFGARAGRARTGRNARRRGSGTGAVFIRRRRRGIEPPRLGADRARSVRRRRHRSRDRRVGRPSVPGRKHAVARRPERDGKGRAHGAACAHRRLQRFERRDRQDRA